KILAPGEQPPQDWGIDGTTGYDFMNDVGALLHDPAGARPLARLWREISGRAAEFDSEEREARREILAVKFHGAFEAAAGTFFQLYPSLACDMTQASQQRALLRLLAELRIYRSYATGETDSPAPGAFFDFAVGRARHRAHANDAAAIAHIVETMNGRTDGPPELRRLASRRFNQLAASLAAKAGEDTALYRYGRLLSRNEVGSDPGEFAISPDEFHARARRRTGSAPLLATATHDHKRGEDARMRLAVLSEIHAEWIATMASWFECNSAARDDRLDPADEYQLYQTLVGSWPLDLDFRDEKGLLRFAERILVWRLKSLHEAKIHTSWGDPDADYENASARFVRRLLDPQANADFLRRLSEFVRRIAPAAALNGLAQCALRCTAPGIPDLYQGAEFWDFSLVDPDNRRPVDFAARASALERGRAPADLIAKWRSGEFKQSLIRSLLALRTEYDSCFRSGNYRPLEATGVRAHHLVCFTRNCGETTVLVAVPRLCARACIEAGAPHPSPAFWEETAIPLPAVKQEWRSLFGLELFKADAGALTCAELFGRFPVAVLVG
ncbi:MAG: malto-oligosyltrehalose synthase, partial [Rhizomicrobium sp.]